MKMKISLNQITKTPEIFFIIAFYKRLCNKVKCEEYEDL